jgi:hypothetical protein
MFHGCTTRTRPRARPPPTPRPWRVSPPPSAAEGAGVGRHWPLKASGGSSCSSACCCDLRLATTAAMSGGGQIAGRDESAGILPQQVAQHPDGPHHPIAPHLAFAQLAGGRRADGEHPRRDAGLVGDAPRPRRQRLGHDPHQQRRVVGIGGAAHLDLAWAAMTDEPQLAVQCRHELRGARRQGLEVDVRVGQQFGGGRIAAGYCDEAVHRVERLRAGQRGPGRRHHAAAGQQAQDHAVRRGHQDRRRGQHPPVHHVVARSEHQRA